MKLKEIRKLREVIKGVNGAYYWLEAMQKIYKLTNAEMGYLVWQLKKRG